MTTRARIELGEYKRHRTHTTPPTDADERLARHLSAEGEPSARLDVRWLANGEVEIQASSWIGVVHFSNLEIHVVPKLVGGSLQVLRMLEYATGITILSRLPADRPHPPEGESLLELICLLLTEEAHTLVRDGLLRDYRPTSDALEVLRGRLRYRDQALRRYGQLDRIHCDFDEYDADTPENHYVAAALHAAQRHCTDPDIRFAATRLAAIFDSACIPPHSDPTTYERLITYNRRNDRYRSAHELAGLLLRGVAFDDLFDTTSGRLNAFMVDMNVVFERFITQLVHDALQPPSPLRSTSQLKVQSVVRNDQTNRTYTTLRPDLVIEHLPTGDQVPIDIKYKLYDARKLAPADIYQTFMYAFALGNTDRRRVGLIYPAHADTPGPVLSIKPVHGPTAARITAAGLDVQRVLQGLAGPDREQTLEQTEALVRRMTETEAAADSQQQGSLQPG